MFVTRLLLTTFFFLLFPGCKFSRISCMKASQKALEKYLISNSFHKTESENDLYCSEVVKNNI